MRDQIIKWKPRRILILFEKETLAQVKKDPKGTLATLYDACNEADKAIIKAMTNKRNNFFIFKGKGL